MEKDAELARFTGFLHADGYSGFALLYEQVDVAGSPKIVEVACWAHVRRGFFDVHASNGSPIAKDALDRIGGLFDIERTIAGHAAEIRRGVRQRTARPRIDDLAIWMDAQQKLIPGKSDLAAAIRYARSRWRRSRAISTTVGSRSPTTPPKTRSARWPSAAAGGERAAAFYTLIRTAKLNVPAPADCDR